MIWDCLGFSWDYLHGVLLVASEAESKNADSLKNKLHVITINSLVHFPKLQSWPAIAGPPSHPANPRLQSRRAA